MSSDSCGVWIVSSIIAIILLPIFLIVGIPLLVVGLQGRYSLAFPIPMCKAANGDYISYTGACPNSVFLNESEAQPISFPVANLRGDTVYNVAFFRARDVASIDVSFSINAPDGTKLYGYDDLHLNETVPEDWTKALTPYGYVEPNYYEAGDKFDIYDRRKDAPCNDFKEGCEYELTKSLDRYIVEAKLEPPEENEEGVYMRVNIASMRVTPSKAGTAVNVWARIDCNAIGGMAIAGIVILCIPAVIIFAPCLWLLSLFK